MRQYIERGTCKEYTTVKAMEIQEFMLLARNLQNITGLTANLS